MSVLLSGEKIKNKIKTSLSSAEFVQRKFKYVEPVIVKCIGDWKIKLCFCVCHHYFSLKVTMKESPMNCRTVTSESNWRFQAGKLRSEIGSI